MVEVVFVSFCSSLVLLFLLLWALLCSSAPVRSLLAAPGFHRGADGRRKVVLLGVCQQQHASSPQNKPSVKRRKKDQSGVISSELLLHAVWRAGAAGLKSTLRSPGLNSLSSTLLPPSSLWLSMALCVCVSSGTWTAKKDLNYVCECVCSMCVCVSEIEEGSVVVVVSSRACV